jgi:Tfp pilus assembly protein PilF
MDQRNFPLAAECYKRALAIDGTSLDVRVDYGACLHGMDLPLRAKDEFQMVLAENPLHAVANFNLGITYYTLNQIDSAQIYWKKYLAIDPNGNAAATARQLLQETGG